MGILTIKKCQNKVLVVGPIYDKVNIFDKIKEMESNYDFIIINGNLLYPYQRIEELNKRIDLFNSKWIFNVGEFDLRALLDITLPEKIRTWINLKPNAIIIEFINKFNLVIVGGGLTPNMEKEDLQDNLEISFVSLFNNESWHKSYGGAYGYIISNNPLTEKEPQFYNYSMQLGNIYSSNNKVYAQEVDQYGLKETILL